MSDPTQKKKTKDKVTGGVTTGMTKFAKVRKSVPLVGTTSSFSTKNSMKGLSKFITSVRDAATVEKEKKTVDNELANIRKNFIEDPKMKGYQKKKYVAKIIYVYMLGYDVNVGFLQAINLMTSTIFTEKQVGYLACGLLLNEEHEMIPLLIQALQDDLVSRSVHTQSLALAIIANIGGTQMAEALYPGVAKLLLANTSTGVLKKKAALTLLRLHQKNSEFITPDPWADRIVKLLNSKNLAVVSSLMSFLIGIAKQNKEGYDVCITKVMELLDKIAVKNEFILEYEYYSVANPWLQVKLLRFLSYFTNTISASTSHVARLREIQTTILRNLGKSSQIKTLSTNHKNAIHCVLFENIDLLIQLDHFNSTELALETADLLNKFLVAKESNIKYLALEAMASLATRIGGTGAAGGKIMDTLQGHINTVLGLLSDLDISIKRRALDLLYGVCDHKNCAHIVAELLKFLSQAQNNLFLMSASTNSTSSQSFVEEIVLKIAMLAEKYCESNKWYVDTMIQLIHWGGDSVPEEIWFRIVQIVTNNEDIQEYSAGLALRSLNEVKNRQTVLTNSSGQAQPGLVAQDASQGKVTIVSETLIRVGSYVLGEFGHLICDKPGMGAVDQYKAILAHYQFVSLATKAILLSCLVKFMNLYPNELSAECENIFKAQSGSFDPEIQQRAVEYLNMKRLNNAELLNAVLDVMPAYSSAGTAQLGTNAKKMNPSDVTPPPSMSGIQQQNQANTTNYVATSVDIDRERMKDEEEERVRRERAREVASKVGVDVGISQNPNLAPRGDAGIDQQLSGVLSGREEYIDQLYKALCVGSEGVLYEDENLQIGIKSEYLQGTGQIMIYYGNMSPNLITGFQTMFSANTSLLMQVQQLEGTITPQTQVSQLVAVKAMEPFSDPVYLNLGYTISGRSVTFRIKFPLILLKFLEKIESFGAEDYLKIWKDIPGPPFEQQVVVKPNREINVATLKAMLTSMRLIVIEGMDPNPSNLVVAGSIVLGDKRSVVLLRLEVNLEVNMIRLTVRSTDGHLSSAVKNLLGTQLA